MEGRVGGGWMDGNMHRQKDEWLERQKDGKFNGWDAGLGDKWQNKWSINEWA